MSSRLDENHLDTLDVEVEADLDIEAALAEFEAQERVRLGLEEQVEEQWTDAMTVPVFTASQRANTTLLVGGLTMAHDYLVEAGLRGIGYEVQSLEVPDNESLRYGKEFGNRGQCNPTYFTVGNLVKALCKIRDEQGLTEQEVVDRYAFLTAGSCGPCRFGMYVTEYRKALRDAGFDGFRVLLFQQAGGIKQATGEELGLVLNPEFFLTIGRALFAGDVINVMQYRLRPYELVAGSVDKAISQVKDEVYGELEKGGSVLKGLWRGRKILKNLEIDRTNAKPKVAVIGEFWAMTTEGDGSYHIQRFLEEEGAEVNIQVLANTLLYNLWEARHDTESRLQLRGADEAKFGLDGTDPYVTMAFLYIGELALRTVWQSFAKTLGLYGHKLPNMDEVASYGHSHYNVELRGGEGHLEVAKLILNVVKQKAHMTLSIKPFGCMPSSGVSDGVQSVITEILPEAIFCPVETSGDGAVNFYSRVQMYLFKARQRAQEEFQKTLDEYGVTREEVQAYIAKNGFGKNTYHPPHVTAGTSADLVHEVAPLMKAGFLKRVQIRAGRTVTRTTKVLTESVPRRAKTTAHAMRYAPAFARFLAGEIGDKAPSIKASWVKLFDQWTKPSDDELRQIEEAQQMSAVEMPRTARAKSVRSLRVMA